VENTPAIGVFPGARKGEVTLQSILPEGGMKYICLMTQMQWQNEGPAETGIMRGTISGAGRYAALSIRSDD
jgi:hypothetical protein